jgi:hypothetical protein
VEGNVGVCCEDAVCTRIIEFVCLAGCGAGGATVAPDDHCSNPLFCHLPSSNLPFQPPQLHTLHHCRLAELHCSFTLLLFLFARCTVRFLDMSAPLKKPALTGRGRGHSSGSATFFATINSTGVPLRRSERTPVQSSRSQEASAEAQPSPMPTKKRGQLTALKDATKDNTNSPSAKKTKKSPVQVAPPISPKHNAKARARAKPAKATASLSSQPTQSKPPTASSARELTMSKTMSVGPRSQKGPAYISSPVRIGSSLEPDSELDDDGLDANGKPPVTPPATSKKITTAEEDVA